MDKNELITSVLTRCVTDPDFLFIMISDPKRGMMDFLDDPSLCPELLQFDYHKLLLFSTFVTKVKNNNTWRTFCHTRLALKATNLEHRFFKGYFHPFINLKKSSPSNRLLQETFYLHLKKFLTEEKTCVTDMILSVLNYEWAIEQLKNCQELFYRNETFCNISYECLPKLFPGVTIQKISFNPITVIQMLKETGSLKPIAASEIWLLYQFRDGKLKLTVQDEIVGLTLSLVDGKKSIEYIKSSFENNFDFTFSKDDFLSFFSELYHQEIIKIS